MAQEGCLTMLEDGSSPTCSVLCLASSFQPALTTMQPFTYTANPVIFQRTSLGVEG